jgi:hypothetical protein
VEEVAAVVASVGEKSERQICKWEALTGDRFAKVFNDYWATDLQSGDVLQ